MEADPQAPIINTQEFKEKNFACFLFNHVITYH
jgi:hypothetical protein